MSFHLIFCCCIVLFLQSTNQPIALCHLLWRCATLFRANEGVSFLKLYPAAGISLRDHQACCLSRNVLEVSPWVFQLKQA
jgi:hypothetical protein